jgi:hypothetical protein
MELKFVPMANQLDFSWPVWVASLTRRLESLPDTGCSSPIS